MNSVTDFDCNNNFEDVDFPNGSSESEILDRQMTAQMLKILPPRASSYDWIKVYSSTLHGFSLSTLYRKIDEWEMEMSPMLLLIRAMNDNVFGAMISSKIHYSNGYYGTGDSTFLFRFVPIFDTDTQKRFHCLEVFRWTGSNEFFVCSQRDFFCVGGGDGRYGLWLDADLNRGLSQSCATFANACLADHRNAKNAKNERINGDVDDEIFAVKSVEVFGFGVT